MIALLVTLALLAALTFVACAALAGVRSAGRRFAAAGDTARRVAAGIVGGCIVAVLAIAWIVAAGAVLA